MSSLYFSIQQILRDFNSGKSPKEVEDCAHEILSEVRCMDIRCEEAINQKIRERREVEEAQW